MRTPKSYQVDLVDGHGRIRHTDTFHDVAEAREYAQAQRTRRDGLKPMTTTIWSTGGESRGIHDR